MQIVLRYELAAPDELAAIERGEVLARELSARLDAPGRLGRLPGSPRLITAERRYQTHRAPIEQGSADDETT